MLRFAPSPMPDELLYSYVARWFFRGGYATENIFNVAAFGRQIAHDALNAYRHTRLDWRGGEILPPDQVAESMTLLPYARLFIGAVDYARHLDPLSPAGDPVAPPKALCQPPWRPTELRYCATCMRQQIRETGVAFWRRTHNLPGVAACTSHGEHLISIAIRRGELAVVPWTPDVESARASETEMWFATQSERLLNADLPVIHMKQWEEAIRAGIPDGHPNSPACGHLKFPPP